MNLEKILKISIDYYMPSTLLEQSIIENGTNVLTLILEEPIKESEKFWIGRSRVNVLKRKLNCWNQFEGFCVPKMINQVDFGKLIKHCDTTSKPIIANIVKEVSKQTKILSTHMVRTGTLSLRDENVWLLHNCFYGKTKSIICIEDELYEFPKTGTFYKNELNHIGVKT